MAEGLTMKKRTLSQYIDSVNNNTTILWSPNVDYSKTTPKFTPKITLSYQATETQLLYASYAKGYRVGGFNAGQMPDKISYNPENSGNYELGYKSTFPDNKIRLNAALFYLYEKDHQVIDVIHGYYQNLGDFKNKGIETEFTSILAKGLLLQWNFSYTDGKFTRLQLPDLLSGTTKNYIGNKIIFNPNVTSFLDCNTTNNYKKVKQAYPFLQGVNGGMLGVIILIITIKPVRIPTAC